MKRVRKLGDAREELTSSTPAGFMGAACHVLTELLIPHPCQGYSSLIKSSKKKRVYLFHVSDVLCSRCRAKTAEPQSCSKFSHTVGLRLDLLMRGGGGDGDGTRWC